MRRRAFLKAGLAGLSPADLLALRASASTPTTSTSATGPAAQILFGRWVDEPRNTG